MKNTIDSKLRIFFTAESKYSLDTLKGSLRVRWGANHISSIHREKRLLLQQHILRYFKEENISAHWLTETHTTILNA